MIPSIHGSRSAALLRNDSEVSSRVQLLVTPWTVARQIPLSMGFSSQGYWSGLLFPSPGDLPDPRIEARSPSLQADSSLSEPPGSLSFTISLSSLKLISLASVMPSNHPVLCHPLLLLPSIFPSIRVFSNESVLHIRWPKYWSLSFSISPSNEYSGVISFRMD